MTSYALRRVSEADAAAIREWLNDPDTLRWARNPQPVSGDEHRRWLRAALHDDRRVYRLVLENRTPVASVRYDRLDGIRVAGVEVSILVAPEARGRGVGRVSLELGEKELRGAWPDVVSIDAVVHRENIASRRLFECCGYRGQGQDGTWITLTKTIDDEATLGGK